MEFYWIPKTPKKAVDLLPMLFNRKLEGHSMFMAVGECIAHLHCLMRRGQIARSKIDGLYFYSTVDDPTGLDNKNLHLH